jgi:hypothetical protein
MRKVFGALEWLMLAWVTPTYLILSQLIHDLHFKSNGWFICVMHQFLDFKVFHNLGGGKD